MEIAKIGTMTSKARHLPPYDSFERLFTVAEAARSDQEAIDRGVPSLTLMENAGFGAAVEIAKRYMKRPVAVLRGPGNNGGDGSVIARVLARRGWPVRVLELSPPTTPDAIVMAERWRGPVERLSPDALLKYPNELTVDALFGAGLSRDLGGVAAETIEAMRETRPFDCVAVDIPSGLDGDTGAIRGAAPVCRLTVTFGKPKPGHFLNPGRQYCGEIAVVDIGTAVPDPPTDAPRRPTTFLNGPGLWSGPFAPTSNSHKYERGHAVVISGPELTGAARLAARAARRAGAGLVTLAGEDAALPSLRADEPGALIARLDGQRPIAALLKDQRRNVFLLGPGRGRSDKTAREALELAASGRTIVLDADALSSLEGRANDLAAALIGRCVLTPHEGEFQRLFKNEPGVMEREDKVWRTRAAAKLTGAVVVLKGSDTVIATPKGRAAINANAPAWLASAGTGDVLAGLVAGLLAQGMDPFDAACCAVWSHGEAGRRAGARLIAEDLPDQLPEVLIRAAFRHTITMD